MTLTDPQLSAVFSHLSQARMAPYLAMTGGDKRQALLFHEENTSLSQSLYPLIQTVELAMRNAMDTCLASNKGPQIYSGQHPVWRHASQARIRDARDKLTRTNKTLNRDAIVAELSLGFWVSALGPKYENALWRPSLRRAFSHRPKGQERKDVLAKADTMRDLRNRIMHHEPILTRDLKKEHDEILTLADWIDPAVSVWARSMCTFGEAYEAATSQP